MATRIVATSRFNPSVAEVEGGVRVALPGIGLVVYGGSAEQAIDRLNGAFDLLVKDLQERGGEAALSTRLKKGGLQLISVDEQMRRQIVERVESKILTFA